MPSDVQTLRRQRDLVREHLRWLESEISVAEARETAHAGPAGPVLDPTPTIAPTALASSPAAHTTSALEVPSEVDVYSIHNEVRRGCFLYATIALVLFGGLVAVIYWRY